MINFTKSVATGNDFIIIDNRNSALKGDPAGIAKKLCDRFYSVGADGLLLLEKSDLADFKMRIFNSDGSEAEMCGNGSRCVALYAYAKKIAPSDMKIETMAGILNANVQGESVRVKLTDPKDIQWNLCLMIHECPYKVNLVNTGVPHVIYFVDDLEAVEVNKLGPKMRYHEDFSPHGANVNFVKVTDKDKNKISVRTYERGVEDETLACGTGAVASAIIAAESEKFVSPVTVETRSGEILKVYFEFHDGSFKNVYLEGKARLVYEGELPD